MNSDTDSNGSSSGSSDEDSDFAIVIDNGSYMIKAGFSDDDQPRAIFPSIVGRPRLPGVMVGMAQKDAYVGDEAQSKRGILTQSCPIEHGIVTSWDDMEKIWRHTLEQELRIIPEEHSVILIEPKCCTKQDREKMTKIMFEIFNVPALYILNPAYSSLCSIGQQTGIVLDSGYECTHIIPVHQGHVLKHAVHTLDIGGKHITKYLMKLMNQRKRHYDGIDEGYYGNQMVIDIKIKYGCIALEYEQKLKEKETFKRYNWDPCKDWLDIYVGNERFECTEILFNPSLFGLDKDGIHKLIYESVMKCDVDIRDNMFDNILIVGGNAMFDGFGERLDKELSCLVVENKTVLVIGYLRRYCDSYMCEPIVRIIEEYVTLKKIKVIVPSDRERWQECSSWIGAAILEREKLSDSSDDQYSDLWITKNEYDEFGVNVVHKKCF